MECKNCSTPKAEECFYASFEPGCQMEGGEIMTATARAQWHGVLPSGGNCNICGCPFGATMYDCATWNGGWAYLCAQCHRTHGVSTTDYSIVGVQQVYVREYDGVYYKVSRRKKEV